jgi:hypothetical protein
MLHHIKRGAEEKKQFWKIGKAILFPKFKQVAKRFRREGAIAFRDFPHEIGKMKYQSPKSTHIAK